MEEVIITKENVNTHTVGKYQFKILSAMSGKSVHEAAEELAFESSLQGIESDASQAKGSPKDELIESLLQKSDEMSSNFIKLQMRYETLQEEQSTLLETAKKTAYDEGFTEGIAHEKSLSASGTQQTQEQLYASIKTLEDAVAQYKNALQSIQQELTHTALEIAGEVIGVETQENSAKIAAKLSSALIEELAEASKITLRVNPADHGYISEKVGSLSHVEVLSDRAINPGGVVAISDVGNIDSQIKKRFERLKRSLLLES